MAELLSKITSTVPEVRRRAIRRLIQEAVKRGEVKSEGDATAVFDRLISQVSGRPLRSIMQIREAIAGERISSEDWNDTQSEVYVDMHALYDQTKNVGALATKHGEINRSSFRESKAAILKAINDVRRYQFLKQFPEYQDAKYIDFNDGRNTSLKTPLANVDAQVRKLELPTRFRGRFQQANSSLRSTQVKITQLGGGVNNGFDEDFAPKNMLDDNPDTFWADLILTDGRVQQTYQPSGDGGLGTSFVSNGVLAEVDLTLSIAQRVNNLTLLPFGSYPVRIVDLAYKESPSANTWIQVPGFEVAEASLEWHEWSFSPITVGALRITLEQVNFAAQIFHLPENLVHNQSLWSQILNQKFDQSIHQVELTELQSGKIAAEPELLAYVNALELVNDELSTFAMTMERSRDHYEVVSNLIKASGRILTKINPKQINSILGPIQGEKEVERDNPKVVEVRKNEFIYGIRSIEISNRLYHPVSYYSSPKYVSNATILEASVDTVEEHPSFNDGMSDFRRTSVEYQVEIGPNIRFPILPSSSSRVSGPGGTTAYAVEDEYIPILRTTQIGFTRFTPSTLNAAIRKNGNRIPFSDYTFESDSSSGKGKLTISANYDPNAVYTISYNAVESDAVVNINDRFNSTDLVDPDIFESTNRNNAIKLSYFPYIEYEIVNDTGSWTKDDAEDGRWRFLPSKQNYKAGTIIVDDGSLNVTGVDTTWNATNLDLSAGVINVLRVKNDANMYKIQSVADTGTIVLEEAFDGTDVSGQEYQIGQAFEADGRLYALDQIIYEPVQVFVNDVKAFNLTDYRSLEHPAFIPVAKIGRQYQFIQAGSLLYFNVPIENAKIEVYYPWLTQYVQLQAVLRSNVPVRTNITPKVDSATLKIKNSKL